MGRGVRTVVVVLAVATAPAWADDAERLAMAQLRLTTDPRVTSGCTSVGVVSDDSVKDLRRKIVRAGGNAALLSFGIDDIRAQVLRCPPAAASPPAPSRPPNIPPPPPGAPPPPPPGVGK